MYKIENSFFLFTWTLQICDKFFPLISFNIELELPLLSYYMQNICIKKYNANKTSFSFLPKGF